MTVDFDPDRFSRTFVHMAPDAVIYATVEGQIQFWNRAAERVFGFSESEALGQSLEIIIPENLRARHWKGYAETMRTGKTRYGARDVLEVPAQRNDGTRISVEFSMLPFKDESGRMVGIAAILRDVTKRFEEMQALRENLAILSTQVAA